MSNTFEGKRLLLISHHNSYRIAPYLKAATRLGLKVTIASQGEHSLVTEVANGIHIDFENPGSALNTIVEENRLQPFAGILGSDDQTVELAAHVAKILQLPHNPPQAAEYSQRKDMARAQLASAGCPVPIHCLLDLSRPIKKQLTGLPWPCVLKPLNMSASRGVIRANDEAEFISACERIKSIVANDNDPFVQNHLLIEGYIDGSEIAYEGYLHNGALNTITIFDKPDPLTGPYFEETIYVTPSALSERLQQSIKTVIQKSCSAYGLTTGAIHAECRIDKDNNIWVLEIASRTIGGDCSRMLDNHDVSGDEGSNACGNTSGDTDGNSCSIEELAISLAIGKPIDFFLPKQARGVMMIPVRKKGLLKRVEGLLAANKVNHIDKIDIIIREGHELIPLPEGNQYLGYIFARADTPEQVTAAIREAYACLEFVTVPIFKIT